jgi:NTP pyrophosphatase (non-canonical NTP hydrolase)
MKLNDYQKECLKADLIESASKQKWILLLGLYNEVGDLIEVFKKRLTSGKSETFDIKISEEIGDILWYVSTISHLFNYKLSEVALENLIHTKKFWLKEDFENTLDSDLTIDEYQNEAIRTDKARKHRGRAMILVSLLGLAGEVGDLLSAFKKQIASLDDDEKRDEYKKEKRGEYKKEIGDILWYVSNTASKLELSLKDIAQSNLIKVHERHANGPFEIFDVNEEKDEKLPRKFEIIFRNKKGTSQNSSVKIFVEDIYKNEIYIGERLTDNSHEDDGYRYHDIFHLAFAAILGWSPVIRALLKRKRKSNESKDEVEDGGRAIVLEEAISAYIFNEAPNVDFFKNSKSVDFSLLKTVRSLASGLEVKNCPIKLWEKAILEGYMLFNKLIDNGGGRVLIDLDNKKIEYLDSH